MNTSLPPFSAIRYQSVTTPGGFSPALPGKRSDKRQSGPGGSGSNTSQKFQDAAASVDAAIIDYLTLVIDQNRLIDEGLDSLDLLLSEFFGFEGEVIALPWKDRAWQFYAESSILVDRAGELVGRAGRKGNGETWCISLSGQGTRWVRDWKRVFDAAVRLDARISRCDVAWDDIYGKRANVHALRDKACKGAFAENGRPPKHRFLSDEGHGTGSTLYVGAKGHKELCVYEKGKQLGDPLSPWIRVEVRLYGKHLEGRTVPLDVLRDPVSFLRGAYKAIAGLIRGACNSARTEKAKAKVCAKALVEWMHRQCGQSLGLIFSAFGGDALEAVDALMQRVARAGLPGRFRGFMSADQAKLELQQCLVS